MQFLEEFINSIPAVKALVIIALGALIWHGIKAFIETYVKSRGTSIAADINLQAEIKRLIASEEAKSTVQKLNVEKMIGAMNILRLMSKVDTKLSDWRFTVYFRMQETDKYETLEDVGRADLGDVSKLMVEITAEVNAYTLLLGTNLYVLVLEWTKLIHDLVFSLESIYGASKEANIELDPRDGKRIYTIQELIDEKVKLKYSAIGEVRKKIMKELSEKVAGNLPA